MAKGGYLLLIGRQAAARKGYSGFTNKYYVMFGYGKVPPKHASLMHQCHYPTMKITFYEASNSEMQICSQYNKKQLFEWKFLSDNFEWFEPSSN